MTYVAQAHGTSLNVSSLGLVSTQHALAARNYTASGTTSDTSGDIGTFTYTSTVGLISQLAPLSGSIPASSSSKLVRQLMVSGANGAVSFVKTAGAASLVVSTSGALTSTSALPMGTYIVPGTTNDANGDSGTFSYTLTVTPAIAPTLHAYGVVGRAIAGRTVTLFINGVGF